MWLDREDRDRSAAACAPTMRPSSRLRRPVGKELGHRPGRRRHALSACMHFMGMLRIVDRDLAICLAAAHAAPLRRMQLRELGYRVVFPDHLRDNQVELSRHQLRHPRPAAHFDGRRPRRPAGSIEVRSARHRVPDLQAPMNCRWPAGNVGCLTGVLRPRTVCAGQSAFAMNLLQVHSGDPQSSDANLRFLLTNQGQPALNSVID